jgi:hypothetical protein
VTEQPTFSWAVLPTWRARYPYRYAIVLTLALVIVLTPLALLMPSAALRGAVVGAIAGGAVVFLLWPLAVASVTGGVFRTPRALRGVGSNQVLSVETRDGRWARTLVVQPVGVDVVRISQVVSWRIWPDRQFDDTVRGLRLALGMPADPPGGMVTERPAWPTSPPMTPPTY